jgi:NAD(P)H-quinone oxidoreductase subunit 5
MLPTKNAGPGWQALYAHISNGFYVNTLFNRLLRAWPKRSRKAASSAT